MRLDHLLSREKGRCARKREASAERKRKRKGSERNGVDAKPSHPKVETGCKAWRRRQGRQENPESRERGAGGLTGTCTKESFCIVLKDRNEESILQRTLKTAQGKERKKQNDQRTFLLLQNSLRRQRGRAKTGDAKIPSRGRKRARKHERRVQQAKTDQANKSAGWMPMALIADEGRDKLRKASGSRK